MKRIFSALTILALFASLNLPVFAAGPPRVEFFSPQGTVKDVRQVNVRFSEPMAPFGDPRSLTDPFTIACPAAGSSRWADSKNWIYDFNTDLPSGLFCEFTLKPGLKSLSGIELTGQKAFSFSTGGPAVIRMQPYEGSTIDEEQIFILTLDAEPDIKSILQNVTFSVEGIANEIGVRLIDGKIREKILEANFYKKMQSRLNHVNPETAEPPIILIQSRQRFPNSTNISLVWGKGVKSTTGVETMQDHVFHFETRKEFVAEFTCTRENPQSGCIPFMPMRLHFTAPVSKEQAKKIILRAAAPMMPHASLQKTQKSKAKIAAPDKGLWAAVFDQNEADVRSVVFNGPFPEDSAFTIELPSGMKDDAGRKLVNAGQFPLAVRTGAYPPLAKFSGRFGILESHAGALLPVTVRNLEAALALSSVKAGADPDKTFSGKILGKFMNIEQDRGKNIQPWLRKVAAASRTKSVFDDAAKGRSFSLPKPNGAKAFEVIGIPLGRPGLYIVELESRILGKALLDADKPMYVQTAALVTNLAAHFKQSRESSLVWVTTLDRGQPVSGADVIIRDCQDKIHWRGKTDARGIAAIRGKLPGDNELPYCSLKENEDRDDRFDESYSLSGMQGGLFVTAQSGSDMTFVHSSWDQGIELWRFQLPEESHSAPVIAHTVFDRTLLRAGDTIHMKHILREHSPSGFRFARQAKWPAKATITHSGSGQKYEFPLTWDAKGIAQTTWAIPKEAKLGRYDIYLQSYESGSFRIEEHRIPLMRGVIKPPDKPLIQAHQATLDVGVQYLAGGSAGNLPIKMRGEVRPRFIAPFEGYEDFIFVNGAVSEGIIRRGEYAADDAGAESGRSKMAKLPVRNLTLDPTGSLRVGIDKLPAADVPRELAVEMEFADPNGEISTISSRVPLWHSQYLIGIKPDSWAASKEALKFQIAVVDISGKPVTGAKVKVDLLERKNYSHRKRLIGGFYAYEHTVETRKIGVICEGKTGARGLLICTAPSPVSGNVILQAETVDDAERKSVAHRDIWVADKSDWWFDVSDSDRMDLIAEKKRYEPGEKAVFQVRMPFREATALITVEREGILNTWVKPLRGKNPVIEVPIADSYAPNVFVSALVVRGRAAGVAPTSMIDLGKPAYKLGIAEINVGWKHHELKLSVTTDAKVYKVRQKAKVRIKAVTAAGKAPPQGSEVAVAVVDEGLLELMPNRSWDLLAAMMGRRGAGVKTATAQMQVVGKRHFGLKALAQGGGGGLAAGHEPTREMFDPLLLWKGRVALDVGGEAALEVPLNDSLTSFRIVAVATAGAGYFGTGYASIRSTQDIMLLSGLAPVVRQGDVYFAPFTVRNTTGRPMDILVSASAEGLPAKLPPLRLALAAGEALETGWQVTAPSGQAALAWLVSVKDVQANSTDTVRITQKVVEATPVGTYQATLLQLDGAHRLAVERPADALPGRGGLKTTLTPKISDGLDGVIDYMKQYPYTCMEQKVSVAVALSDEKLWKETMAKLPAHLDKTGLVRFFPLTSLCGSPTLTSYILAIAQEANWPIPDAPKQQMQNGLKNFIAGKFICASPFPAADLSIRKLAAIEALSRYGQASAAMLGSISIEPNLWPTSAVIDWRNILRNVQDIPDREARGKEAEQLLRSRLNFQGATMGFSTEKSDILWWLMISADVNAVRALLALMPETSWRDDMPRLAQGALSRQKRGHWDLTLANAWGVLAMEKFSRTFESVPVSGQTVTTLDQQTKTLNWQTDPKGKSELFAWPQKRTDIRVSHSGSGKPWLTVRALAAIPLKEPIASGYKIKKTISVVSQKRPNHWTKGDVLRVRLDLEAQADQTWVVVNDPAPSGATILGSGLGRDSQMLTSGEKREGRVWPAFEERSFEAFRAYYEYVPKGNWRVEYTMRLNATGKFHLPATRVEAMYFPEMMAEMPNADMTVEP